MTNHLPSDDEIGDSSLDGQEVVRNFRGKSLLEAEELFAESLQEGDSLRYFKDLMWMNPIGFRYYIRAAVTVASRELAHCDAEFMSGLATILTWWYDEYPVEVRPIARLLSDFCGGVMNGSEFDQGPHVDLREKYRRLAAGFSELDESKR